MFPAILFLASAASLLLLTRAQRQRDSNERAAPFGNVPEGIVRVSSGDAWALTFQVSPAPPKETLAKVVAGYTQLATQGGKVQILSYNFPPAFGVFNLVLQYLEDTTIQLGTPIPLGAYTLQIIDARRVQV